MIDNTPLLHQLLSQRQIDLEEAAFLTQSPTPLPEK